MHPNVRNPDGCNGILVRPVGRGCSIENITITSQTNAIAWPFSITSSVSASSASWNSEAFTGTNVAGASYSSFKISSSGTLRVSFVDGADIYKGNIVYRPMATIYYGI